MSLDVYLELSGPMPATKGTGIFIREDGQTKELTREEWDAKFPGKEPLVVVPEKAETDVYWSNITSNLHRMAQEAGIGDYLWDPKKAGVTHARDLIDPLIVGLYKLENDPERYQKFNSPNRRGSHDNLVKFVTNYLAACQKYPEAVVRVSR